jgi:hypothetical protein
MFHCPIPGLATASGGRTPRHPSGDGTYRPPPKEKAQHLAVSGFCVSISLPVEADPVETHAENHQPNEDESKRQHENPLLTQWI